MRCFMKYSLFVALVAGALVVACGGDSSSNATGESYSSKENLSVDEKTQTMVIRGKEYEKSWCVVEDGRYTWKSIRMRRSDDTTKYGFLGDTLVRYPIYEGELLDGDMYVGGRAGNLNGTWTSLLCVRNVEKGETLCGNPEDRYSTETCTISGNQIECSTEYDLERYISNRENTINSLFMSQLFNYLHKRSVGVDAMVLFAMDSLRVQDDIFRYNIKVDEATPKSVVFEMSGKTYVLKVNTKEVTNVYDGSTSYEGAVSMKVNLEFTDGETTCNLDYYNTPNISSLCSAENEPYFIVYGDGLRDLDGNDYDVVTTYEKSNNEEFEKCLDKMVVTDIADRIIQTNDKGK